MDFKQRVKAATTDAVVKGLKYDDNFLPDGGYGPSEWATYEEKIKKNLYGRTGLALRFRNFRLSRKAPAHLRPVVLDEKRSIRVACISSTFWVTDPEEKYVPGTPSPDLTVTGYRDGSRLCEVSSNDYRHVWLDHRIEELEAALDTKELPDIICFGELAYPPPPKPDKKGWTVEAMQECVLQSEEFQKRALKVIKEKSDARVKAGGAVYDPFIFLGSYHCLMTLYSIGVTYPWGNYAVPVHGRIVDDDWLNDEDAKVTTEVATPAILYKKRFPARRVGESTRVPASMNIDIFNTPLARIALLLCSDVLDLNQFMAISRYNKVPERERIDFVLVPSYNASTKLASMCCELSFAARCAVVLVNANPKIADFPATELYVCGMDARQLLALDVPRNTKIPKPLDRIPAFRELTLRPDRTTAITYYDADLNALKGLCNYVDTD